MKIKDQPLWKIRENEDRDKEQDSVDDAKYQDGFVPAFDAVKGVGDAFGQVPGDSEVKAVEGKHEDPLYYKVAAVKFLDVLEHIYLVKWPDVWLHLHC